MMMVGTLLLRFYRYYGCRINPYITNGSVPTTTMECHLVGLVPSFAAKLIPCHYAKLSPFFTLTPFDELCLVGGFSIFGES
jgi:hypothetical protein